MMCFSRNSNFNLFILHLKKMISKSIIKLTKSLAKKKYRLKEGLFLAEGDKTVLEVLNSKYSVAQLFATEKFMDENEQLIQKADKITIAGPDEIKRASLLQHPQNSFALCKLPGTKQFSSEVSGFSFYLDGLQDPGNLGTILRTCDWFGISRIFCSQDTTDVYNPKVIQASMGSFCRVNVIPVELKELLPTIINTKTIVFGTFLEGKNIYDMEFPAGNSIIIMGNEGKGIRKETEAFINEKILIPSFSEDKSRAESLNVAVAAGIICSEFKRRIR